MNGNLKELALLLSRNPDLAQARSSRVHRSTLLHYLGANGVESHRQLSPKNAAEIAETLLKAGAEVDSVADMYRGSTTLGLVVTSIHPARAGVLEGLIEVLLDYGASIDSPGSGSVVNACLANGRKKAAELMAGRGALLDLEGASGIGRLDLVKSFFDSRGNLANGATVQQMTDGFAWACEFGRTEVIEFLLQRGIDVNVRVRHHGQTGLHWAAGCGYPDSVALLLKWKASVDAKDNTWGASALGWALNGWSEEQEPSMRQKYYEVVALLVAAGAAVAPEWLADEAISADARMMAALDQT